MSKLTRMPVTVEGTGESMVLMPEHQVPARMEDFVKELASPARVAAMTAMSEAYDRLCLALLSDNDVQREGSRAFKKKSAWRKLQKAFGISTRVVESVIFETDDGVLMAKVTVEAKAPWGQSAEAVGACGLDEETGRRTISRADMIATAETRATNRAVSNLIAAGEVSAEEIGDRKPYGDEPRRSGSASNGDPEEYRMPFGSERGRKFRDLTTEQIRGAAQWAHKTDRVKFKDFLAVCEAVVKRRAAASAPEPKQEIEGADHEIVEADDDVPF